MIKAATDAKATGQEVPTKYQKAQSRGSSDRSFKETSD